MKNLLSTKWWTAIPTLLLLIVLLVKMEAANIQAQENDTVDNNIQTFPVVSDSLLAKAQNKGLVRIIVGLKTAFRPEGDLVSPQDVQNQRNVINRAQNSLLNKLSAFNVTLARRFNYVPYLALEVDAAALTALSSNPDVRSIQEDIPAPPVLAESVPLIGADDAWAAGFSGAGWTIAILDTGVDKTHPFLAGKVVSEACFSSNSAASNATSVCPDGSETQIGDGAGVNCAVNGCDHGSHVAGIAAGRAFGATTFSGVARDADLIAIQVFSRFDDDAGNQPCADFDSPSPCVLSFISDQIAGLERVFDLRGSFNIAAVNMSLGGGEFTAACDTESQKGAIDNLRSVDIATVIAAGNDGFTNALGAPACISTAISVGSTTKLDAVSNFSNSASFLDLLAPGSSINSSIPGSNFAFFDGTSMATPHVAGAWAILKSQSPGATVDQVLADLRNTGVPITDARNNITTPRINLVFETPPDLTVVEFNGPLTAALGTDIAGQLNLVITNEGDNAASSFELDLVISLDNIIGNADDQSIGTSVTIPGLEPAEVLNVSLTNRVIPADWPVGNAFIGVILDTLNSQEESNEDNNTSSFPVQIIDSKIIVNACTDQNADGDCNDLEDGPASPDVAACLNDDTNCQPIPATFSGLTPGSYVVFLRFTGASQGYYPTSGRTSVDLAGGEETEVTLGAVYPVHPKGVAVHQQLNKVYIAFQGPVITGTQQSKPYPFVAVIDGGESNEVLYTIPGGEDGIGREPWGVAVSGDNVYVGSYGEGRISVINAISDSVVANLTPGGPFQPTAPAVDPITGLVHFPDYRGGRMVILNGLTITPITIHNAPAAFSPFEMVVAAGVPSRNFVSLRDALHPNRFKYVGLDNPDGANLNYYNVDVAGTDTGTGAPYAVGLWQNGGASRLYLTYADDPRPANELFPNPNKLLIYDLVGKDPVNPRSQDLGGDFAEVGLIYNQEANHMLGTFAGFAYNDSAGDDAACAPSENGGTYVVDSGDTVVPGPLPSIVVGNPPLVSADLDWVNPFEIAINPNKTAQGQTKIYVTDRCWNDFPALGGNLTGGAVLILFDTPSGNPTPTPTPTSTATATITPTPIVTNTPTSTITPTNTPAIVTDTPTATSTPITPTLTATPTETPTPTNTPLPIDTPTPTDTSTPADTPTATPTPTDTPSPIDTPTSTATPTETPTPISGAVLHLIPDLLQIQRDQTGVTVVEAANIIDLYAVEFHLTYDPALVEVVDADAGQPGVQVAIGSIFNSSQFFVIQNEANNGVINFSATLQAPATSFSGTGSLIEVTWLGLSPGQTALAFSGADVSTQGGQSVPVTSLAGQLQVAASVLLQGQVQLQDRSDYSGITATMADRQTQTGSDGRFELEADGSYVLTLTTPGYLSARTEGDTGDFPDSSTINLGSVTLLAGEMTGDDQINILDLVFMANRYGGNDPTADINRDGRVNIFDLALVAANYGTQGPLTTWQ